MSTSLINTVLSRTEEAAETALTMEGETGSGAEMEEKEEGPLQLQVEFITELDNLRISKGGAVEVGIDECC